MTIAWTTDESGNSVFTHEEWRVTAWRADDEDPATVTVTHPMIVVGDLEITSRGMRLRRLGVRGALDFATIPFPVLAAIVEARGIIAGE